MSFVMDDSDSTLDPAELEAERVKLVHMHKHMKDAGSSIAAMLALAQELEDYDDPIVEIGWDLHATQKRLEYELNEKLIHANEAKFRRELEEKRRHRAENARAKFNAKRTAMVANAASSNLNSDEASHGEASSAAPPAKKAKRGIEPPRRPGATDAFYSYLTDDKEHWAKRAHGDKLRLSHIGRIQETDAGEDAPYTCNHCEWSKEPCRVYKEEGIGKFFLTGGTNTWRMCARCRCKGYLCNHFLDAKRNSPTAKEIKEDEEMDFITKFMANGAHYPGEAFVKAEVERIRREKAADATGLIQES